jgi:hypothetical protein
LVEGAIAAADVRAVASGEVRAVTPGEIPATGTRPAAASATATAAGTRKSTTAATATATKSSATPATPTATTPPHKHQRRTCSFRRSRGDILTDAAQRGGRGDSLRSHEPDQRDWRYIKQRLVHRCGLTRWCLDGLSFQRETTSRKVPASIKAWLRDTKRHACRVGMYSSKMHWPMPLIYINWSE